jgi:hypothetical protein
LDQISNKQITNEQITRIVPRPRHLTVDLLKIKNLAAPAVKREAEEDWGAK